MNCPTCNTPTELVAGTENSSCPSCYQNADPICNEPQAMTSTSAPQLPAGNCEGLVGIGASTEFTCPRCPNSNLQVAPLCGTQVCFCAECRGFAIDQNSLGELIEILRASYDGHDDLPTPMNAAELNTDCYCPTCHEKMDTFPYCGPGAVVMDACRHCKLSWFDRGELVKIIRAPGQRGFARSTTGRPLATPVRNSVDDALLWSLLIF